MRSISNRNWKTTYHLNTLLKLRAVKPRTVELKRVVIPGLWLPILSCHHMNWVYYLNRLTIMNKSNKLSKNGPSSSLSVVHCAKFDTTFKVDNAHISNKLIHLHVKNWAHLTIILIAVFPSCCLIRQCLIVCDRPNVQVDKTKTFTT